MFALPFGLNLGDVINLTHPRYGFELGANAIVVKISERPTEALTSIEFWR
jgi:hypothetical protein